MLINKDQCVALLAQLHADRVTDAVPAWVVDTTDGYVLTLNPYMRPRAGGRRESIGMVSCRWSASALLEEAEYAARALMEHA